MAVITFPTSPNDGDTYIYNGVTYEYSATSNKWSVVFTNAPAQNLGAVSTDIIPAANVTYDLGSADLRWKDLYLSGNTLVLGDATISATGNTIQLPAGSSVGNTGLNEYLQVANTTALVAPYLEVANTTSLVAPYLEVANTTALVAPYLEVANAVYSVALTQPNDLTVTTGEARWFAPFAMTIESIKCFVETAPVGSSVNIDILKNGTSIATPTIADGVTNSTEITTPIDLLESDYLTVDITQIGSTTAGSNLNIVFKYKRR